MPEVEQQDQITHHGPADVTVTFSLGDFARYFGFDDDGPAPRSLREEVIEHLAKRVERQVGKDVTAAVTDIVRDRVGEIVQQTLEEGLRPTNMFGEPTGQPSTTLREMVVKEATNWLKGTGYHRDLSPLQKFLREAVDRTLKQELQAEVDKAKAQIRDLVKDQAATLLQETITRSLR